MATKAADVNSKKFIGVRLDSNQVEELQGMADERKMSLNELVKTILSSAKDPNILVTTAHGVRKSLEAGTAVGDDAHANVQRLHDLIAVRDHLDKKREQLQSEKPNGFFAELFESEELQDWRRKAKALELKYRRLVSQIDELEEQVLASVDASSQDAAEEPQQENE